VVETIGAAVLARDPAVDGIIHNAAPWLPGRLGDVEPEEFVDPPG
jgi:hypothetical protein